MESEAAMLASNDIAVRIYEEYNHGLSEQSLLRMVLDAFWSRRSAQRLEAEISLFKPDVVHVHNFFPRISPAVFWVARRLGVPTIMTLHNFRYACAQGMLLRDGQICELCLGRSGHWGVFHRCYRGSFLQSLVLVASFGLHKVLGTFKAKVCRYIALNEFCRAKFVAAGLPAELMAVKPNFVDLPKPDQRPRCGGLFVGRLSPEKGLETLLAALEQQPGVKFTIVGDGPMAGRVSRTKTVDTRGWLSPHDVQQAMCEAAYLVVPSLWYETFGLVVVEAFACGLPVIASRHGALAEIVEDGVTGLLFEPGSANDLARALYWAETHPDEMRAMGQNALEVYQDRYSPDVNYKMLMNIYQEAIDACRQSNPQAS
ncbi:glycosyltransferase family 4 protein [Desulfomicrobium baculatum]|uniref:glycosyltransferase family 4 protein n=1 Tax=Desulfomicrobium baculatum TaxID=899 RepID=UPI00019E24E3|nr:glycosyltransferase family 4 protein [Desulfomicrobium baculatum]